MNLPERLVNRLAENKSLKASIELVYNSILSLCGNSNNLFFFPEYTDHGPDHINAVLDSADSLIREECRNVLTPEDTGVLIFACLLHDAAMHLTADPLMRLISDRSAPLIPEFDKLSWSQEFESYFSDAQRWDDRKLYRILGDQNNSNLDQDLASVVHIHPQNTKSESWSTTYRKFLGEFIRLHHARLAHEFAIKGFPTASNFDEVFHLNAVPEDVRDLAGVIARSHNLPLRATFDYLQLKYDSYVTCRNIHPIYLMVLLRIADYLQIKSTRVNKDLLVIQKIRSPLSQEEWNTHLDIKDVRIDDNDIESIYVSAKPKSVSIYLKTQSLLTGLQNELDTSWAVLGEVYSQRKILSLLGINLRRVRSNVSNVSDYEKKHAPPYYPIRASFETTSASLTKLLVKPLYGDVPGFGIRELAQNALDAVRELTQYLKDNPELDIPRLDQSADVLISLEKKNNEDWLTISDRGVGMTAEIVSEYFLKAGASFRTSDFWWKNFGSNGKSKVLRSGRFGVGALAAFLLGNKIEVTTRHFLSAPENGVQFSASIQDSVIQLQRIKLSVVGTIIKIKLSDSASLELRQYPESWDWYVLDDPSLERKIDNKAIQTEFKISRWDQLKNTHAWRTVKHKDFEAVQWSYFRPESITYNAYGMRRSNELIACNGIIIGTPNIDFGSDMNIRSVELSTGDLLETPSVLVYDPDGKLSLNLQRTTLESSRIPFFASLLDDIVKDFIAFLLVHGPTSFSEIVNFEKLHPLPISLHNAWGSRIDTTYNALFSLNEGFGVLTPSICKKISPQKLITFVLRRQEIFLKDNYAPNLMQCFALKGSYRSIGIDSLLWTTKKEDHSGREILSAVRSGVLITSKSALLISDFVTKIKEKDVVKMPLKNGAIIWKRKNFNESFLKDIQNRISKNRDENIAAVTDAEINWKKLKFTETVFDKTWQKLCPHSIIPYDLTLRRKMFASSFNALKDYIRVWEDPRLSGWRGSLVYNVSKGRPFRRHHRPKD